MKTVALNAGARGWSGIAIAFAAFVGGWGGSASAERAAETAALQFNEFPNGFCYAVMPHSIGTGRISIRLIVHAGSLVERDGEEGYAHFVEHMHSTAPSATHPGSWWRFFSGWVSGSAPT